MKLKWISKKNIKIYGKVRRTLGRKKLSVSLRKQAIKNLPRDEAQEGKYLRGLRTLSPAEITLLLSCCRYDQVREVTAMTLLEGSCKRRRWTTQTIPVNRKKGQASDFLETFRQSYEKIPKIKTCCQNAFFYLKNSVRIEQKM